MRKLTIFNTFPHDKVLQLQVLHDNDIGIRRRIVALWTLQRLQAHLCPQFIECWQKVIIHLKFLVTKFHLQDNKAILTEYLVTLAETELTAFNICLRIVETGSTLAM